MSDLDWAEALLDRFIVPLLGGNKVHIAAPLGPRGAQRLLAAVNAGLDGTPGGEALCKARQAQLAELGRDHLAPPLSDDSEAPQVLVALHDLLFLQHPEASRLKPEGRDAVLRGVQKLAERAALTAEPSELETLYGRHSLLGPLFALGRDDIRRPTRRGPQLWKGTSPPRRWLGDDDDQDEALRTPVLPELAQLPGGGAALRALFCASPLTDLYHPLRPDGAPPVEWHALGGFLRLPQVARLLTRRYLELGLGAVGPSLAEVLLARLSRRPIDAATAAWLCLLSHLQLVAHVVAETALPADTAAPPTLDFYGLYAALYAARPELAMPPDAMSDATLRPAIQRHVERCARLAGPPRVQKLLSLLGKTDVQIA